MLLLMLVVKFGVSVENLVLLIGLIIGMLDLVLVEVLVGGIMINVWEVCMLVVVLSKLFELECMVEFYVDMICKIVWVVYFKGLGVSFLEVEVCMVMCGWGYVDNKISLVLDVLMVICYVCGEVLVKKCVCCC